MKSYISMSKRKSEKGKTEIRDFSRRLYEAIAVHLNPLPRRDTIGKASKKGTEEQIHFRIVRIERFN